MRLRLAVTPFARMRGMLKEADATGSGDEVFLVAPCQRIHTFGMRFALDVAWIAADGQVLRALRGLTPGKLPRGCPQAVAVLERRACVSDWFLPGQQVELGITFDAQRTLEPGLLSGRTEERSQLEVGTLEQKGICYETLSNLWGACS